MKSQWFLLGALGFYIVVSVVCLVTGVYDLREGRRQARRSRRPFDFDKFCADITPDDRISDPFVLIDKKWVRRNPPSD